MWTSPTSEPLTHPTSCSSAVSGNGGQVVITVGQAVVWTGHLVDENGQRVVAGGHFVDDGGHCVVDVGH